MEATSKIDSLTSSEFKQLENALVANVFEYTQSPSSERAVDALGALMTLTAKQWLGVAVIADMMRDEGGTEAGFVDMNSGEMGDATDDDLFRCAQAVTLLRELALFPKS